uniref:Uncharacterized protein n=1 Tax=Arundo donax TaxID=35708 RepID=A0A0A9C8E3_ARUDO
MCSQFLLLKQIGLGISEKCEGAASHNCATATHTGLLSMLCLSMGRVSHLDLSHLQPIQ